MTKSLTGRIALVTGARSSGLEKCEAVFRSAVRPEKETQ
jgi:hypothetical protein